MLVLAYLEIPAEFPHARFIFVILGVYPTQLFLHINVRQHLKKMTENHKKSDRQYAAYMARKFFSGQISKHQILESFPDYEKDFKIRLLYNRIMKKPRKNWLFGVSEKKYQIFMEETYELIDELETGKLRLKTMDRLFRELWLHSNNCTEPIEHIWFSINEVAKSTNNSSEEIRIRYLEFLIEKGIIELVSRKPLHHRFTELGKKIRTENDIMNLIKNVA